MELRSVPQELLDKSPPQSRELESAVIGLCLQDAAYYRRASAIIRNPEAFYHSECRSIWNAMAQLDRQGGEFDMVTVADRLHRAGFPGAAATVARLSAAAGLSNTLEKHCFLLVEYHVRRQCIRLAMETQTAMFDVTRDVFDSMDALRLALDAISDNLTMKAIQTSSGLIQEAVATLRRRMENPELFLGLPLPVRELYNATHGMQAPDLWILAARPAMGKTAVALGFVFEVLMGGGSVGVFSLEMSSLQITNRLLCLAARKIHNARLSNHQMRGRVEPEQYRVAETTAAYLLDRWQSNGLYMDDTAGIGLGELKSKAVTMKTRHDVKLIVVDYLQLVTTKARSREEEISTIVRTLKNIAKELSVPVLALSQLSRKVEERSNKRPGLSDLRESGEIEQAADNVVFLYRPEYYGETTDENGMDTTGMLEFIIAKQRNGSTGMTPAFFEPATGLVTDWGLKPDLFSSNAAAEFIDFENP